MELYCAESFDSSWNNPGTALLAPRDRAVAPSTAIGNMLFIEDKYSVSQDYFMTVQSEVRPHMRKVLAVWMIEVTEEEQCEDSVFCLAMNLVDRFLSRVDVKKAQLQLLGCVCLLLASKMRQSRPLTVDRLVYFSDFSISASDIRAWELVVLNTLEWNAENVLACDYFSPLFEHLLKSSRAIEEARKRASGIHAMLSIESSFIHYAASLLAAACVAAAVKGFHWSRSLIYPAHHHDEMILSLSQLTTQKPERIVRCLMDIDMLATASSYQCSNMAPKASPPKASGGLSPSSGGFTTASADGATATKSVDCTTPTNTEPGHKFQPETPTDVQDVDF